MEVASFDAVARQIPVYRTRLLELPDSVKSTAFDIRFKSGCPINICGREGSFFLKESGGVSRAVTRDTPLISSEELQELFLQVCEHSVFSHEHEIKKGYVRMNGGYRVGVCGTAVMENGYIKSVRDITTIVFRIPREKQGCADRLFIESGGLSKGALVIGEPSSGKTTFLRDIVYSLSVGKFSQSRRVAVLDERGEIEGRFDLGPCADVLTGYPKREGLDIAIRMLSPEFVVCDELSDQDLDTVKRSVFAGAVVIASVHAGKEDIYARSLCRELLKSGAFKYIVELTGRSQPCEIESISVWEGKKDEAFWRTSFDTQRNALGDG